MKKTQNTTLDPHKVVKINLEFKNVKIPITLFFFFLGQNCNTSPGANDEINIGTQNMPKNYVQLIRDL